MRKDGYHHGDLRAALVEASRRLVEEKGPDRLTMSDACRAAGVSTAAPYRHFPDMDAILLEVAEQGMARQRAAMERALLGAPTGSLAAVVALGRAYLDFALAEPGVFRLMFALTRTHRGHTGLIEAGRATFGLLLGQVAAHRGTSAGDPAVMDRGLRLWALVHGLAFLLLDEKLAGLEPAPDPARLLADASAALLAP